MDSAALNLLRDAIDRALVGFGPEGFEQLTYTADGKLTVTVSSEPELVEEDPERELSRDEFLASLGVIDG